MTRNWLVTDEEIPVDLATSYLDNMNGVGTRTSVHVDVPRLRPTEPAEPTPVVEDEPVTEEISDAEGKWGFIAATVVLVVVSVWLIVEVGHAIATGVLL